MRSYKKRLELFHKRNDWMTIQGLKSDGKGGYVIFSKAKTRYSYEKDKPPFVEQMGR